MPAEAQPKKLGLALSGGGSRAAAFHRGTLRALLELGLVESVEVISTVSGGSLFGGAWMNARAQEQSDTEFLKELKQQLEKGFVGRTARSKGLLRALLPFSGYSRTNALSDTFDGIFFKKRTLAGLPESPKLCINTTIMNNGQVGKFSREGFSARDLRQPSQEPERGDTHYISWGDFSLSLAVTASAAFPVLLPPVDLPVELFPSDVRFVGKLKGVGTISLTDGGVLENLGIQSLLASERFGCWDMVVSDAGTHSSAWSEKSFMNSAKGFGIWVASGRILDRIMSIMNDKENRWARQQVIEQMQASWMAEELRAGRCGPGMQTFLEELPARPRRKVLFVRVAQNWKSFMTSLPKTRLVELNQGSDVGLPDPSDALAVESFLKRVEVDLTNAKVWYQKPERLGGDAGANACDKVATNFTALSSRVLDQLEAHAAWQVHATHAIYGI